MPFPNRYRGAGTMNTYEQAAAYLGTKSDRPSPNGGERATRVIRRDPETIAVRYQATDVVTYKSDGRIIAENGGWFTSTTKNRIGEYSPIRISQTNGLWSATCTNWEKAVPYANGLTYHPDGTLTGYAPEDPRDRKRKLDRLVKAYIGKYCESVRGKGLTLPGLGDCMACHFSTDANTGKPVEGMGYDHYLMHFEEGYFVPSLLARAIRTKGYADPGFIWQLIDIDAKQGRTDMLRRELSGFFRRIKPALLAELERAS